MKVKKETGQKEESKEEKKKSEEGKEGKTNLQEYFEEMIPLGESEGLTHSYEVRVEMAIKTEEKFQLHKNYFKEVHHSDQEDMASFERFLCNSPVYDPDNLMERLRPPSGDYLDNDKPRVLKSEGANPEFRGTYHMLHYIDGELAAVGVLDILDTLLVSCQLMYHSKYKSLSLGRMCLLREIEWARQMAKQGRALTHYCLQDYAVTQPKFAYKVNYFGT